MTHPLTIQVPISDAEAELVDGRGFIVIPVTDEERGFLKWAINGQASFIAGQRQELATHHQAMETSGVADKRVAASLELLLQAAIKADQVSAAIRTLLARAIHVSPNREDLQ